MFTLRSCGRSASLISIWLSPLPILFHKYKSIVTNIRYLEDQAILSCRFATSSSSLQVTTSGSFCYHQQVIDAFGKICCRFLCKHYSYQVSFKVVKHSLSSILNVSFYLIYQTATLYSATDAINHLPLFKVMPPLKRCRHEA